MGKDLFGDAIRPRSKHYVVPEGYAASPGTGPIGETCKSCKHRTNVSRTRRYPKCGLMREHWNASRKTDILVSSRACLHWDAKDINNSQ